MPFDDDYFNIDPNEPQDGFAEGFFDTPAPEEYEYTGEGFLGAMGDIGRGLWEGTLDDLVGGAFQLGEWVAPSGSPLEDAFASGDDYITRLLDTNPELFKESETGEKARAENWLNPRGWLHPGMKSVGPMVGAALTGPAAPAAIGMLYYGRTSQEALEDSFERFPGWDEKKRLAYANTKGVIEGGGEAIQMALFRGLWKGIPTSVKGNLLKGASGSTKPGIGFLKRFLGMIAGEEVTETGQEYTGRATDYWYGLEKEMPTVTQSFKDVFGPTLIASMVMGSGGSVAQMQADKTLNQNLSHKDTPRDIRTQAAATVYQRVEKKDKELADQWWESIKGNLALNDPIIIGDDVNYREQLDPEETALKDIGEEAAPLAEEGAPTTEEPFDDTGIPFEEVAAEEELAFGEEPAVDLTETMEGPTPEAESPFVDITPEDLGEAVAMAEADLGLEPEPEIAPDKEQPEDVFGPSWEAEQEKVKTEASELEMAELEEAVTGRPVKFALKKKIEPLAEPAIAGEGENLKTLAQEPGEAGIKALSGDEKVVEKDHYEGAFGNHRFVKRDDSGKIIGAVQVLSKGAKNVVTGIYVTPEARRQKVGSDLIDTARGKFPGLQVSQFLTEPGAEFFGLAPKAGDRATEWYAKLTPGRKRLIKESYDNYLENQDLISEDQAIADFKTVIEISKNLEKEASKAQDRPEAEAIAKEFDPEDEFNIGYDYYDNMAKTWNFTAKGAGPNSEFATSGENDGVSFGIKDLTPEAFSNRFDEKVEEYSKKVDIKFSLRDTEVKGEQDEEKRPSRDRRTSKDRGIDGERRVKGTPSEERLDVTKEIRIDDIRKAFPTASVQSVEGGFVVDLPNGAQIFVNLVGEIAIDREAALKAGYTEEQIAELSPAGSWVTFADEAGIINLSKIAGIADLNHETFHAAMELVLTPEEVADVLSKFEREEDAAKAYGDWAADQDAPHTAFQKIAKFFKGIVTNLLGGEKAVFARVKSGKPFGRAVRATMKQRVPVSQWTPEMMVSEMAERSKYSLERFKPVETDSIPFRRWFGDSKVVDEDGNPLVVHHGGLGIKNIDQFEDVYGGQTTGNNDIGAFHFTDDLIVAEDYGRQSFIRRYQDDPESLIDEGVIAEDFDLEEVDAYEFVDELAEDNIETKSVYLSMENPIEIDMEGQVVDVLQIEAISKFAKEGIDETFEFYEQYYDQMYGEFDQDDIESNREEIEELARDNYALDEDEGIEEYQFKEASKEYLQEQGIEPEHTPIDGIIIRNMIDDIGDASNRIADQYIIFDPTRIKSATSNTGDFSNSDARIKYSLNHTNHHANIATKSQQQLWYSDMVRSIDGISDKSRPQAQWQKEISQLADRTKTKRVAVRDENNRPTGEVEIKETHIPGQFRRSELEWSGVLPWLSTQSGKVSKERVMNYLDANLPKLGEVVLSEYADRPENEVRQYFDDIRDDLIANDGQTTITDDMGNSLRIEMEFYDPAEDTATVTVYKGDEAKGTSYFGFEEFVSDVTESAAFDHFVWPTPRHEDYQMFGPKTGYRELVITLDGEDLGFRRPEHYPIKNVVVHARFNTRADAAGRRTLHIEELQSDHLQALRAGKDVKPAPFLKEWPALGIKRLLRWATDNGYDQLTWTTGTQQADRFSTAFRYSVDKINWKLAGGVYEINAEKAGQESFYADFDMDGNAVSDVAGFTGRPHMSEIIGKNLAGQITSSDKSKGDFEGDSLTVGAEGFKTFYDSELVNTVNKIVRPFGSKVSTADINVAEAEDLPDVTTPVHSIEITPKMREAVPGGASMWSRAKYSLGTSEPWYSTLGRAAGELKQQKGSPDQMLAMLKKSPGVKQEEIDWVGLETWMLGKKSVTKDEIVAYLDENDVQLEEVLKGVDEGDIDTFLDDEAGEGFTREEAREHLQGDEGGPKFADYQLAGGEQYRELLLTLPDKRALIYTEENVIPIPPGSEEVANQGNLFWYFRVPDNVLQIPKSKYATEQEALEYVIREKAGTYIEEAEKTYTGGHYDEANVLAHVRFNERVDADGQKVLFIEEIQSDWHQAGRKKGYQDEKAAREYEKRNEQIVEVLNRASLGMSPYDTGWLFSEPTDQKTIAAIEKRVNFLTKLYGKEWVSETKSLMKESYPGGVPDAPFKKTWNSLALKRIITYASQNGFDKVAWTTGTQQNERYDLSKQINMASAIKNDDGTYNLIVEGKDGQEIDPYSRSGKTVTPDEMEDVVGKDLSKKLTEGADKAKGTPWGKQKVNPEFHTVSGIDLKIGGGGMKGFYDKILPSAANKLIKKYGGRVGETDLGKIYGFEDQETVTVGKVHSFNLTTPLKAKALGGMPKFSLVPGKTKPIQHADKLTGLVQRLQDNQTDILTKQRELARYIQRSLPIPERGRRELISAITKLAVPKTKQTRIKYFQKALELTDKRVEDVEHKEAMTKIKDKLKRLEPKKEKGKATGKLGADAHAILTKIQGVMAMSPKDAAELHESVMRSVGEEMENITPEQKEQVYLLSRFADLQNRNSVDAWRALEDIVTIEETGRFLFNIKEDARKARDEKTIKVAVKEFTGQDDISMAEIIEKNRQRKREEKTVLGKTLERLGAFDTMHQSWEWKLDDLSKYSKDTDPLKGLTTDHFRRSAHIATTDSDYGSWEQMQKLRDKAEEIYGVKGRELEEKLLANTVYVEKSGVFNYLDGEQRELNITQNEAYKLWQWIQDPTLKQNMASHGFTSETEQELERFMSPEVKEWAEWQIYEFYPQYYESINKVYKAMYHVDLPYNPMYTPMVRERGAELTDDMLLITQAQYASTMNSGLKLRIDNKLPPRMSDGDAILSQHITQMEHFKAWAEPVREMRSVLGNPKVQAAIQAFHGTASKTVIQKFINDFARGGADRALVMKGIDSMRSAFVKAVIGANPVVFAKQLTSFPAFATDMPIHLFLAGMVDFAKNPVTKGQVLMTSKKMKMRGVKGWERDIADAMKRAAPAGISEMSTLTDKLMFPTKIGDKAAIMAGGWSVYKWKYDGYRKMGVPKEKAHAKAIVDFEMAYERGQQASGTKDQSHFQRMGSLYKAFTMFMTSPQQYYNHLSAGYRNLYYGRGSKAENIKRIAIAQFVLPMIFQFMASGFEWDDEDQMRAVLMGPFNGLFIAKDFAEPMIRAAATGRMPRFGNEIPIVSTATGLAAVLAEANRIITSDDGDIGKAIDKALSTLSKLPVPFIGGVPYDPLKRIGTGIYAAATGETEHPVRRSLGWSKYALERDEEPTGRRKVREKRKVRRSPERRQ